MRIVRPYKEPSARLTRIFSGNAAIATEAMQVTAEAFVKDSRRFLNSLNAAAGTMRTYAALHGRDALTWPQ